MSLYDRVAKFMLVFGQIPKRQIVASSPQVPPDDVVRNRCKWQLEETLELLSACFDIEMDDYQRLDRLLRWVVEKAPVDVDLVAYADANADIRYVAYGNDIAAGIYSPDVDAEVCASNDSKSPPGPDGKVQKGPNYKPPNIEAILREQGWKKL